MTLLRILGIDKYTRAFKTWIRNKFIAKGGLRTINNQSIEGEGNIEVQANAEIFTPESIGFSSRETTNESRVFRAFYDIQTDEFIIKGGSATEPLHAWLVNKCAVTGQILSITIKDGEALMYSCVAEVILNPTINVQFDYLDTHYILTWNADTLSWGVTKTPINTDIPDIDPVVWKYLCDPIQVYDGVTIPQDVLTADGRLKYLYPGMYKVGRDGLNLDINYIINTCIYTRYTKNDLATNYIVYFNEPDYIWRLIEEEEA